MMGSAVIILSAVLIAQSYLIEKQALVTNELISSSTNELIANINAMSCSELQTVQSVDQSHDGKIAQALDKLVAERIKEKC